MTGYKITIEPCDPGQTVSADTIKKGAAKSEGTPHQLVIVPTSAQYQGILGYLGLVDAGSNTSTVETAITALSP